MKVFDRALEYREEDRIFVQLAAAGISDLSRGDELIEWSRTIKEVLKIPDDMSGTEEYARALDLVRLAKDKKDRAYSLLYERSVVATWSSLEILVEDFLVALLANDPQVRQLDAVARIQVSLAEFYGMDEDDRLRRLAHLLQDRARVRPGSGADHLDRALSLVGYGGPVDPTVGKSLHELHQIRNVIVHRGGVVDLRLSQSCPWLTSRVGERVDLGRAELGNYYRASGMYTLCLMNRIRVRYGLTELTLSDVRAATSLVHHSKSAATDFGEGGSPEVDAVLSSSAGPSEGDAEGEVGGDEAGEG